MGQILSFTGKIWPSLGGVPHFLSREQLTALPHSVTQGLEEPSAEWLNSVLM